MGPFSINYIAAISAINLSPGAGLDKAIGEFISICAAKAKGFTISEKEKTLIDKFLKDLREATAEGNEIQKLQALHRLTFGFLEVYDKIHPKNNAFKKSIALFIENIYLNRLEQILQPNPQLAKSALVRKGQEQLNKRLEEIKNERRSNYKFFRKIRAAKETLGKVKKNYNTMQSDKNVENLKIMANLGVMLMPIMEYMAPQEDEDLIMQYKSKSEQIKSAIINKAVNYATEKGKVFLKEKLGEDYEQMQSPISSKESIQMLEKELKNFTDTVKKYMMTATNATGINYIRKSTEQEGGIFDSNFDFNAMFHLMYDKLAAIDLNQPLEMLESLIAINDLLKYMLNMLLSYHPNAANGDNRSLFAIAIDGNNHLFSLLQSIGQLVDQLQIPEVPEANVNQKIFSKYREGVKDLKQTVEKFNDALKQIESEKKEENDDVYYDAREPNEEDEDVFYEALEEQPKSSSLFSYVTSTITSAGNMLTSITNTVSQAWALSGLLLSPGTLKQALDFKNQYRANFETAKGLEKGLLDAVNKLQKRLEEMAKEHKNLTAIIHPLLDNVNINAAQRAISLYEQFFKPYAKDSEAFLALSDEDKRHFVLNLVSLVHNIADLSDSLQKMLDGLMQQKDFIELDPGLVTCLNNLIKILGQIQTAILPELGFVDKAGCVMCNVLVYIVPGIVDKITPEEEARTPEYFHGRAPLDILNEDCKRLSRNLDQLPRIEKGVEQKQSIRP